MTPNELLDKYLKILAQINEELTAIIESSRNKRQAIILNDVLRLENINRQEENRLHQLQNLESLRMNALRILAEVWGVKADELSAEAMTFFIKRENQDFLKFYRQMIELIKENMQRLQDLNRENQELTLLALDYIDEMQHLVLGEDNPGLYTDEEDGALEERMRKSIKLIDKKV